MHQDSGAGVLFRRIRIFAGATARAIRDRIEYELSWQRLLRVGAWALATASRQ